MSIFSGIFGRKTFRVLDSNGFNFEEGNHSGKYVNQHTTLQLSTAWRCVRLRSRVLGSLPLGVHERLPDGGSRPAKDHWLDKLIQQSPNADQTPAEYWGGNIACVDLWGNGFSKIERASDEPGSRIVALTPMRPDRTRVFRDEEGTRRFRYTGGRTEETLGEQDVFHLRGFTLGGDEGLSAISYGRHTIGGALAADETAGKTFAKGLNISGFVELATGTKLTEPQRSQIVELFNKFTGSSSPGKVMPLDPGMKFVPLTMSPADAQLLETRGFNVEEICRWFDVPPILIGHAAPGQTMWGSGVEQIMLGWLTLDLNPFLRNIEQAIEKQLLTVADRGKYFVKYNREGLLEADTAAKSAFLSQMSQNGLMTRNEGRSKLNLPKVDGGDELTVQSNLTPLSKLGAVAPRAVQPAPGEPVV